ncbi:MerR family DNA-binding transcriptional regulator [Massilia sp. IC2-278]|uniref:helix-turn-helix domain-containing protein n=1 Tax=Massilia sp. IC2-278 TaxID=2887200 RepID=UPI0028148F7D|nr:MerR family DNA-binding transcriptional regulator [Massilia sp. IC2-278]
MALGQVARLLGITVKSLQRWESEGLLAPVARTASNWHGYTESQLHTVLENDHAAGTSNQA